MSKPHSIMTINLTNTKTPAEKRAEAGWAGRHGTHWPKGTVLPETRRIECPRVRVADLPEGHLKKNHIEGLEQNQKIASCCRHPENHDVAAFKSHPEELAPDIYEFYCNECGRTHRFFCVGKHDERPHWSCD